MIEGSMVAWFEMLDAAVLAMAKTMTAQQRREFLPHLEKMIGQGEVKLKLLALWKEEIEGRESHQGPVRYLERRNALLLPDEPVNG